jgi:hypothetical protein
VQGLHAPISDTPSVRKARRPERLGLRGGWLGLGGLLAMLALATASCAPAPGPAVSPPTGVVPFAEERGFDTLVGGAEVDLLQVLRKDFGHVEARRWKVPRSMSWEALRAYYAAQLGPDWKPDPHFPEQGSGYRRSVWRLDGGLMRAPRILALGYIDNVPADFAVLITAENGGS